MRVLGIDTATRSAAFAVLDGAEVLAERSILGARDLAATAFPAVEAVLGEAGLSASDLELVAVSAGPGSFTGLRIGMSIAKGLAFATGCEVVAVPTLEALAMVAAPRPGRCLCTVLDARKGEVYAALFDGGEAVPRRLIRDCAVTPRELAAEIDGPCTLIGDGVEPYLEQWRALLPQDMEILPFSEFHPEGRAVAAAGIRYRAELGPDSVGALVPRYVRPPEAEQTRLEKSQHGRGKPKIDRVGRLG